MQNLGHEGAAAKHDAILHEANAEIARCVEASKTQAGRACAGWNQAAGEFRKADLQALAEAFGIAASGLQATPHGDGALVLRHGFFLLFGLRRSHIGLHLLHGGPLLAINGDGILVIVAADRASKG